MAEDSLIDVARMIKDNRDQYSKPVTQTAAPKQLLSLPESNLQLHGSVSQAFTIQNLMMGNQQMYVNPVAGVRGGSTYQELLKSNDDPFSECVKRTLVPEMVHLNSIYNYKTIIKKMGLDIHEGLELDKISIQRREREKAKMQEDHIDHLSLVKKGKVREANPLPKPYKNYISKLGMDETGKIKLYCVDLSNEQDRKFWIISLNPQDFGNKRPAPSIVQDKYSGRFFLYDNSSGKILIYSPEILTNTSKDRPLIAMSMNEDPPRQDPLLYIYEDIENGNQASKSILMVVGGYQKGKGKKQRPLKTIKIFEVKKRDVSLTALTTLIMQYPRMHPIMFTINNKAWMWQRQNNESKEEAKTEQNVREEQMLMIMGGNILSEQMLNDNFDIADQLQSANRTVEYIPMRRILEYINRAQMITTNEDEITDDVQGMNYSKFKIEDTLTIKVQNENHTILEHLHHAVVIKQADDVFTSDVVLYIIGGGSVDIYQISTIEPKQYEISLKLSNLYNEKLTYIHSRSMTKTMKKEIFFMDDTNHEGLYKLGVVQRPSNREAKCCKIM